MDTQHELGVLAVAIKAHGKQNAKGEWECPYGVLFTKTADLLEALNGTLRAGKRQKKISFPGELLMMPGSADVLVTLLAHEDDTAKAEKTLP